MARRNRARLAGRTARRRQPRLFLRRGSRRHGRVCAARRRPRDRALARRGAQQAVERRDRADRRLVLPAARGHDVHDGVAAFGHRRHRRQNGVIDPGRRDRRGRQRPCRDRALRLRARRFRDHFRDRADCDPAAPDPCCGCALGFGAGAPDPAIELPAAAFRLCADDGAWRIEGTRCLPSVPACARALSCGAVAPAAGRPVLSATDPHGAFRRRRLARAGCADVGRRVQQAAPGDDRAARAGRTRRSKSAVF